MDARRRCRPPSTFSSAFSSSDWDSVGGVRGVSGEFEPLDTVPWEEPEEMTLKLVSVTESERTPRGSSGIGLSGWEVEDTGISW